MDECICLPTFGHHASFCPARDESKCLIHKAKRRIKPEMTHIPTYPNGCPIITEGPQRDDL